MLFPGLWLLLLALLLLFGGINGEFYSSIHEMTRVYKYEERMLLHMQKFIADNQSKLDFLRARLGEFETERNEAQQWGVAYFESPLNKYLLTKRLTLDWERVENLVATPTGEKPLNRLRKLRSRKYMPDDRELEGAIDGLLRLQYIYRLKAKHIAAGVLDGIDYGIQLTALHCFDIARLALRDQHPRLAHSWLMEAQKRLEHTADQQELKANILALMVKAKVELSDFRGVNSTYQQLLSIQPASENHLKNYEDFLSTHLNKEKAQQQYPEATEEHEPIPSDPSQMSDFDKYRFTCSGHIKASVRQQRHLRCGYLTETHPFLYLAPIKTEELNHNPLLVLYHDVIYQSEIDVIKTLTDKQIIRARIMGLNESVVSNVRTSQFTFIPKTRHKVLETIDERVADMTNLNMNYAEDHQFANYGIGGHYGQHHDWFGQEAFDNNLVSSPEMGNRIATVLFYLSDVAQGGGTAFPHLKQLLQPKKYAAAFWHNLHASGVGDVRTLHGACPIIVGSKWVQNRWIREYTQADRRPCEWWDDAKFTLKQILQLNKMQ